MRIAIVGGTGSVGMATARLLCTAGHEVAVVSRRSPGQSPEGLSWLKADVCDAGQIGLALSRVRANRVVHLASLLQYGCEQDPAAAIRVNIDGTLNVLEACRAQGVERLVFGSSIAVYGQRSDLMRESDSPRGEVNLYGATKHLGEVLGRKFAERLDFEFVALRYSGIIGPGVASSAGMASIRQSILRASLGEDVDVEGACGDERVQVTHVNDAAQATALAVTGPSPRRTVYNIAGPGSNYASLRELYQLVCAAAPGAGHVKWHGRGISAGPVDTTAFFEDFGFVPSISLESAVNDEISRLARRGHSVKEKVQ